MRPLIAPALLCVVLSGVGCEERVDAEVVWPLARTDAPDADLVTSPYGPRDQSDDYDFHAGMDLPTPEGTKVRAIHAGVVERTTVDNDSRGPGKWVLVDHGGGEKVAYLHLSKISVSEGAEVVAGQTLGRSGSTGARSPHLHLNYMAGIEGGGSFEALSRNPLEILPHTPMPTPGVSFEPDAVVLDLVEQPMTVQLITLEGGGVSRSIDYADIVALGNPERDEQVQGGLYLEVVEGSSETHFSLRVSPEPGDFVPDRVIVEDYAGDVVLDATRP